MKTFQHKKDIISMVGLIGIIIVLNLLRYFNGYGFSAPILILTLFLAIMVFWMWLISSYSIDSLVLTIKSGPFSQKVNIGEIKKLKSSSPSFFKGKMSKYKITIYHGKSRKLSVYPTNKEDFVKTLKKLNPAIKVE